jgi:hypothetical protein
VCSSGAALPTSRSARSPSRATPTGPAATTCARRQPTEAVVDAVAAIGASARGSSDSARVRTDCPRRERNAFCPCWTSSPSAGLRDRRLVVRRVRSLDRQAELLPSWELFPFATNRTEALALVEADHRQHAVVVLCIRDPQKSGPDALPLGQVHRQRRLDRHRLPGPQQVALNRRSGPARADDPRAAHPQTPAARAARPPNPHRAALDAAPAGPLALARRLPRSAHTHPRALRSLTASTTQPHDRAHTAALTTARSSTTTRTGTAETASHRRRSRHRLTRRPSSDPAQPPQPATRHSEPTIGGSSLSRHEGQEPRWRLTQPRRLARPRAVPRGSARVRTS